MEEGVVLPPVSWNSNAYANWKRKDITFEVGDKKCVGLVVSKSTLPLELSYIHNVFHVSMLRRYRSNPNHLVQLETLEVEPKLPYEEDFAQIFDREMKMLRNKRILLIKVLWRNHNMREATWERESLMKEQYPKLFAVRHCELRLGGIHHLVNSKKR
ncbi:receptor-like protein kinase [Gossypium australe]|uniref:Receptor-like protein kinase n=1 Tax=Gossypium australe TaxID=47621 RepID=A0A5B6TZT9_9ROSI|nr:receptor-like protein kinase [Gossypium australe]